MPEKKKNGGKSFLNEASALFDSSNQRGVFDNSFMKNFKQFVNKNV